MSKTKAPPAPPPANPAAATLKSQRSQARVAELQAVWATIEQLMAENDAIFVVQEVRTFSGGAPHISHRIGIASA